MLKWHKRIREFPKPNSIVLGYWPKYQRLLVCAYCFSLDENVKEYKWYIVTFEGIHDKEEINTKPVWWAYINLPLKQKAIKSLSKKQKKINRFDLMEIK